MDGVGTIELDNETYNVNNGSEIASLNGIYSIKEYLNPHPDLFSLFDHNYETGGPKHLHAKSPYLLGHILYKTDEPDIEKYIDLGIKATYEDDLPSFVDTTVKAREQMCGGTICPTRDDVFRYKGKLFSIYGRYIYGYNKPYVSFLNKSPTIVECEDGSDYEDDSEYEDVSDIEEDYLRKEAKLTRDEIILPTVPYRKDHPLVSILNDYTYCFKVTDQASGNLDVFALYI